MVSDYLLNLRDNCQKGVEIVQSENELSFLSFSEIHHKALRMLSMLNEKSISRGCELLILTDNIEEFIITYWACVYGGVVAIPLNGSEFYMSNIKSLSKNCRNPFYLIGWQNSQQYKQFFDEELIKMSIVYPSEQILDSYFSKAAANIVKTKEDEIVTVMFSSGSLNEPRGAAISNKNIHTTVKGYCERRGYDANDISCMWLPLMHNAGLIAHHITCAYMGMQHRIINPKAAHVNSALLMESATQCKATMVGTTPSHLKIVTQYAKANKGLDWDLSSVRTMGVGGEPIGPKDIEDFVNEMKPYRLRAESFSIMYGLSESTSVATSTVPGKSPKAVYIDRDYMSIGDSIRFLSKDDTKAYAITSVGVPVKGLEVKILTEDGRVLSESQVGLVYLKGDLIIQHYYGIEDDMILHDGWLNTEDVGMLYHNELYIISRYKNIFFFQGRNYYCSDLVSNIVEGLGVNPSRITIMAVSDPDNLDNDELICFLQTDDKNSLIEMSKKIRKYCIEFSGVRIDDFIALSVFPRTNVGKIKAQTLKESFKRGHYKNDYIISFRNDQVDKKYSVDEIQDVVQELFCTHFNKDLKPEDNYFDYCDSSMEIAKMHFFIDEVFPGRVNVADLFQYNTMKKLSLFIFGID